MRKIITTFVCTTLFLSFEVNLAKAQHYLDFKENPQYEIFQNIITQALKGNYSKIETSVNDIKDIVELIDNQYSDHILSDIKTSIKNEDEKKIINITYRLIYLDIINLFSNSIEEVKKKNIEEATSMVRTAYLNYLVISPKIQDRDFDSDQHIRKIFRNSLQSLDLFYPYGESNNIKKDPEILVKNSNEIQKQILSVFPEIKRN